MLGYAVATVYYQLSLVAVQPVASLSWIAAVFVVLGLVFAVMKRIGQGVTGSLVVATATANSGSAGATDAD